MIRVRSILRQLLPPLLLNGFRMLFGFSGPREPIDTIMFTGNYASWEDAKQASVGYDAQDILNRVKSATSLVKHGMAAFERDSIIFAEPHYPYSLIAYLQRTAFENDFILKVLDFGGALGSSYYQCKDFLLGLKETKWAVVEQEHFVKAGREAFQGDTLLFYNTIEECAGAIRPNLVLLSGVIQYLERPHDLLEQVSKLNADYIVVDRTPFYSENMPDKICVQHVSPALGKASYPIWLFGEQSIVKSLDKNYLMIDEFDALDGILGQGDNRAEFKGMVFKKRIKNV